MGVHASEEVYLQVKELLGIPADEPILVFRAQDQFAVEGLAGYVETVVRRADPGEAWYDSFRARGQEFIKWQHENTDKVKVPD
jgi:hypothetical protein